MKGNLLGEVIDECRKRGVGATAYLNGVINHQLTIEKPGIMKTKNMVVKTKNVLQPYFFTVWKTT